jgi:voltage-gated potassium channel
MEFTFDFIRIFAIGLYYAAPLLLSMLLIIVILGLLLGRLEGWSRLDALYLAFITATTVGYGDIHPRKKGAKVLAVIITFVGIVFTGIVVAIALHAASHAFNETHDSTQTTEQVAK